MPKNRSIDPQLAWLSKHGLLFFVNVIILFLGAILFVSRIALGIFNLPPNLSDIVGWRTTPTSDHVLIWIGLLVFSILLLRHYKLPLDLKAFDQTYALVYACADLLLVVGTVDVCWQFVSYFEFHTSIIGSIIWADILFVALYLEWGRISLKQVAFVWLMQLPLYAVWLAAGFPTSITIINGVYTVTQYQFDPYVCGIEVLTWIGPCIWFLASQKRSEA